MKQGKKLNRKHKEFLVSINLDARDYLVERDTTEEIRFINKNTNKLECFKKNECGGRI